MWGLLNFRVNMYNLYGHLFCGAPKTENRIFFVFVFGGQKKYSDGTMFFIEAIIPLEDMTFVICFHL